MGLPSSQRNVQRLVDAHYLALYRYAFRLTGSANDAEDITQEAFCTAQEKFDQLRDPKCVKPWLFSIVRNAYLHRIRAQKHQKYVSLESLSDVPETPPEPLPAVEPERLQQVLNELSEEFRTPIILFYFDDFSYREIAEQMDLPLGTVMSRLARAKAHLRSRLLQSPRKMLASGQRRPTDGL